MAETLHDFAIFGNRNLTFYINLLSIFHRQQLDKNIIACNIWQMLKIQLSEIRIVVIAYSIDALLLHKNSHML